MYNNRFHTPCYGEIPAKIAVLIPCYNESITISKVVNDFREILPQATVYVYDNNSSDDTTRLAEEAGAIVVQEPRQGKGNVVRQMIRDIDADYYILVDGDDTYPAEASLKMLEILQEDKADMVVGDRITCGAYGRENKRRFHGFGNKLVRFLINRIYGKKLVDVMTGYRAFNRVFAKTLPVTTDGFEVETELSIHAVDKSWRIAQIPVDYRDRPAGSKSKLKTFSDGTKVLGTILSLFKDYKPLALFVLLAILFVCGGIAFAMPIIIDYFNTGFVRRFPSTVLALGVVGTGLLCLACGMILDSVAKNARKEYEVLVTREYGRYREELKRRSRAL